MSARAFVGCTGPVALAALAALATIASGCEKKKSDYAGIGKWRFTSTTLEDAEAESRCQPTELSDGRQATWCFGQAIKVAGRDAALDLYFLGTKPDAKLIEIQLKIGGCDDSALDQWMRTAFGPPIETRGTRAYWKNSYMWMAALMPSEPGRCLVHMLPLSENAEIERIKQK